MARRKAQSRQRLEEGPLFWGAILGFILGSIAWFFNVPQRGIAARRRLRDVPDELREQLVQQDAVATSLEEGKEIARRRRFTED